MTEWENRFGQNALDKGKRLFLNGRVSDLKENNGNYTAAVLGRERFPVSLTIKEGKLVRGRCVCPLSKGGGFCEHMAAAMYAVNLKETAREQKRTEEELMQEWKRQDAAVLAAEEKEKQKKKTTRKSIDKKAEAARKREEERKAEELRRAEEERKAEELRRAEEQRKADEAREAKKAARKQRKAERALKEQENKKKLEEERQKEYERAQAEEARRQAIREKKEQEAARRAQKRKQEEEAARAAARRREENRRAEEEKRKQEERRKQEEQRQVEEMMKKKAKQEILARRKAEEEKQKDEEYRKSEFTLLGDSWEETDAASTADLDALGKYSYFNIRQIVNSMELSEDVLRQGRKLYENGDVEITDVTSGYETYTSQICSHVEAVGRQKGREFGMSLLFSRKTVLRSQCGCSRCASDHSIWYTNRTRCPHTAALLYALEDYMKTHTLSDATDYRGRSILAAYERKWANSVTAGAQEDEESLSLVPRLAQDEGELLLSFRVGKGKMFVVKKLDEFCENVRNSRNAQYGSSTVLNHQLSNFKEESRRWVRFVDRIVQEEERVEERLAEKHYYTSRRSSIGGSLELIGWRLDEFYNILGDEPVEYEDKDERVKNKRFLHADSKNPKAAMRISEGQIEGDRTFHGIQVTVSLPKMHFGTEAVYFVEGDRLYRSDKDFMERIEPLVGSGGMGRRSSFFVGRSHMAEFYYRVLPELEDIVDVTESNPKRLRRYLPPEARFVFYMDADDGDITCRIFAKYGDREVSAIRGVSDPNTMEAFRDEGREQEIVYQASRWLPDFDEDNDCIRCDRDEASIFRMMSEGVESLMSLGEVRATRRFQGLQAVRHMKVSVGVSVSEGMLDLDITTENVPREELLDILAGYRQKKKYFRLKDGSFVDLNDQSLEMMDELMEAMHLKPAEFIKGRMHLPLFRTLYLDRMLEENEEVYSTRDSHFREMVKGFKTVNDADFEEPESLSRIMRKYQKNGFKWLRTLEEWGFGGILADDMGLGKTLQVIAVLLSAKMEGRSGTSLVVAPASLVFNWEEELHRFAPDLSVTVVAGSQAERREKIENAENADVLVTSYDLLRRDIPLYEDKKFRYEIIDEAQYIKNHTTAATKAVKVVKSQVRYALTGTPIENRLSELWSIFDYLMPGFLYGYDVFKKEFETPIAKNKDENAVKRLQKMVSPFILRRLKENVLKDLPEKLEEIRYVRFDEEQQKLYDGQVLHLRESISQEDDEGFNKNRFQILAELTRLRQICCDPALCFEDYRGGSAKEDACIQLIQSAIDGGHRILVFSQFTSMLEILEQRLAQEQISYYKITGSTSKEKRLEMVKDFNQGDTPVFLISLKAGGVGLNLTGADVVIHYDPWWNQAVQNQATDRAHRIGQTKKVTVYKLIAKNSIEEKIQELQETKQDLADQVIGGETGQLAGMTREDFLALLEG